MGQKFDDSKVLVYWSSIVSKVIVYNENNLCNRNGKFG